MSYQRNSYNSERVTNRVNDKSKRNIYARRPGKFTYHKIEHKIVEQQDMYFWRGK